MAALIDQVDSPEDLKTCYLGVYTIQDFWKDLHRSMHLWLLQYLYIPLGGNNRHQALNVLLVFAFFVFTHNIALTHAYWGLLTCAFICLEVFMRRMMSSRFHLMVQLNLTATNTVWGKYLLAFPIAVYLAIVMGFDMAVFIMGWERVWVVFGSFLSLEGKRGVEWGIKGILLGFLDILRTSAMLVPCIVFIFHWRGF